MIVLYSGTCGSGKSLHTAAIIRNALKIWKIPVICNFDINKSLFKGRQAENFHYWPNEEMTPDRLKDFSREYFGDRKPKEDSIYLIIDEAQMVFNARSWNAKDRDKWNEFFTVHRHFGFYVILVAQFDRMLDRQIRGIIEYEYVHRKVSNYGYKGFILSLFMGPGAIMCVKVWYPMKEKTGQEVLRVRKSLYKLYDSYQDFSEAKS